MGHDVEQQPLDLAQRLLEGGREVVGELCGEDGLVADRPLGVRHDVVNVLRRRQANLLAPVVDPRVLSAMQIFNMQMRLNRKQK